MTYNTDKQHYMAIIIIKIYTCKQLCVWWCQDCCYSKVSWYVSGSNCSPDFNPRFWGAVTAITVTNQINVSKRNKGLINQYSNVEIITTVSKTSWKVNILTKVSKFYLMSKCSQRSQKFMSGQILTMVA